MADDDQPIGADRPPRPASSRVIDRVTDTLGREWLFVTAAAVVVPLAVIGLITGTLNTIASIVALVTW